MIQEHERWQDIHTASCIVVPLVAETVTDFFHYAAALDILDGDVVIVHACRFGVDAGELGAAVVATIYVLRISTGAGATISTIVV